MLLFGLQKRYTMSIQLSYGVHKDSFQVPPTPPPPRLLQPGFQQVCLLSGTYYLLKIMRFFSFNSLLVGFDFAILFACVFYSVFYSSSPVVKPRIINLSFAWLPIWSLIKSCDITKEAMFWKLQAVVVFQFRKKLSSSSRLILSL